MQRLVHNLSLLVSAFLLTKVVKSTTKDIVNIHTCDLVRLVYLNAANNYG